MESDAVIVRGCEGLRPWEKCEEYAYEVIQSDDKQLFELKTKELMT